MSQDPSAHRTDLHTMALVDSLLSAIVRLDGDALVMHVGEKPYVITSGSSLDAFRGPLAWGQVELSAKILTVQAVSAMLGQLLPGPVRQALDELGAIEYELPRQEENGARFVVIAARGGDDVWLEIRQRRPEAEAPPVEAPAVSPVVDESGSSAVEAPAPSPVETPAPDLAPLPVPVAEEPPPAPTPSPSPVEEEAPAYEAVEEEIPIELEAPARVWTPPPVVVEPPDEPPQLEVVPDVEQEALTEADVDALVRAAAGVLVEKSIEVMPIDDADSAVPAAATEDASATEETEEIPIDLEAARFTPPAPEPEPDVRPAVVVPIARVPRETPPPAVSAAAGQSDLDRLLRIAAARGASALYVVTQAKPILRVDGEMQTLFGEEPLTAQAVDAFMMSLAQEPTREAVRAGESTEWICDVPEVGRVRCLSFRDHRGPGVIFRMLPPRAISAEQLALSKEIQALSALPDGLVIVAGPRSSGKSTLISAFVDLVNRSRSEHVVTIESQILFVHERHRSFVSQREVRGHADEVAAAVRAAVREDPDVLVIEDLRSADVIAAAVDAAEAGRLVFGGVPAASAGQALERLIDQFPAERRGQIQTALAATLRGVVAQVLLRKRGGGRVAARELLFNTPAVAAMIGEGKLFQLPAALESGRRHGMFPLNDALAALVRGAVVDPGEAYRKAVDRDGLVAQFKRDGIDTSFVERLA